jgi:hypothetical protein
MFFLPFLTFKDKITKKLKGIEGSPWLFGIIVNLPIISIGAFISFIDLGLRMYWIPDNYWVDHWILYLALMMIATLFYIALGGFAGWLASAVYELKKRSI